MTGTGPNGAASATVTVNVAEAVPPDETLIGLGVKLEKLTPGGALVTAALAHQNILLSKYL